MRNCSSHPKIVLKHGTVGSGTGAIEDKGFRFWNKFSKIGLFGDVGW